MLTQLGAAMAGIIDSVMVGHFGTTELAAVSFANSIFFTVMVFCFGALMSITPLVGYAYVQHDGERVSRLYRSGLRYCLLLILFMLMLLCAFVPVMPHMGQDSEVIRVALPYYWLAIASVPPFLLGHYLKQYMEGLGNTMIAMIVTLTLNLVNIPLNWIFIFGHLGCPAMGATGAGVATLIIRTLQPIAILLFIRARKEWQPFRQACRVEWSTVHELMRLGLPIGLQQAMEIIAFTFSVTLVGWISKEAVAAHQIANHLSDLTFMVSCGIGAATTIRVAHQYGAGRLYDMRMAARASIHLGLVWSLVGASVMIGGSRLIPLAFTSDPEVISLASSLLILAGLFQISDALQCIGGAMLRGLSDVRVPMYIAFVTYIVIALPLGYVLMFPAGMGVQGMWVAFIVGLTIAAVALHSRFYYLTKKMI